VEGCALARLALAFALTDGSFGILVGWGRSSIVHSVSSAEKDGAGWPIRMPESHRELDERRLMGKH
jgi:hypothetical protein